MDMAIDQASVGNRFRRPLNRLPPRSLASLGLASVTNLSDASQCQRLVRRRSGCIVTAAGCLAAIHGRWWAYRGNLMQVAYDNRFGSLAGDICELYYHQPWSATNFLTLSYIHTGHGASLSTLYAACLVLDEVARLRRTDAIVCHATNDRISDRFFARWGWQAHCLHMSGRHFIKRFYGKYPETPASWQCRLTINQPA